MNLKWLVMLAILITSQAGAQETPPAAKKETPETQQSSVLTTQKEKVSYGIGVNAAMNFKRQKMDLDLEALIRGLRDGFAGNQLLISEGEIAKVFAEYQKELAAKQTAERKALGDKNKQEGDAFLAENQKKEGVVTLPSGLQYKILKAGEGKIPTDSDTVDVHYRGTLIDGTEFDNSYKRGQPLTVPVKGPAGRGLIPGFTEALKLMPVGSKWQLFISSDLAYGERGSGDRIGPNATLIFEVELLSIKEPKPKESPETGAPAPSPSPAPAPAPKK